MEREKPKPMCWGCGYCLEGAVSKKYPECLSYGGALVSFAGVADGGVGVAAGGGISVPHSGQRDLVARRSNPHLMH